MDRDRARIHATLFATALLVFLSSGALAQTIKLGSLVPRDSHWDAGLRMIATEWSSLSEGSVVLRIYPGGIVGDELGIIRKMRIGQIDAAALSVLGLNSIYSGVASVGLPSLVRTDEELHYVLQKMRPFLERELEDRGFKVILWTNVGWAYFFTRAQVSFPDDLKNQRLFVMQGDSTKINAWKEAGFNVVPLGTNDVLSSLQSGMVDAVAVPPLIAAAYQWFGIASHMTDYRWAPLLGAVVVRTKKWETIDDGLRPSLLESARGAEEWMWDQTKRTEGLAIEIMKANGLVVHQIDDAQSTRWETLLGSGFQALLGRSFQRDTYEMAERHLADFREGRNN